MAASLLYVRTLDPGVLPARFRIIEVLRQPPLLASVVTAVANSMPVPNHQQVPRNRHLQMPQRQQQNFAISYTPPALSTTRKAASPPSLLQLSSSHPLESPSHPDSALQSPSLHPPHSVCTVSAPPGYALVGGVPGAGLPPAACRCGRGRLGDD